MDEDAKRLLRQCAENLLNAVNRLENAAAPNPYPNLPRNTNQESQSNHANTSQHKKVSRMTAAEEHRSLFGYRPPSVSCSNHPPPPKRRMVTTSSGQRISMPVRNTWSHNFLCLTKKGSFSPPNAVEKVNLALAGLGELITFNKNGNAEHVHEKILEAFPMFSNVGGYEILRVGGRSNRLLILVPIPPGGYTVNFLKSTLASAKGYLRPLQKDLTIENQTTLVGVQSQICTSPRIECINCLQIVPMGEMKNHEKVCGGGSSLATGCSSSNNPLSDISREDDIGHTEETGATYATGVTQLQGLFPNKSNSEIREALEFAYGCLEKARGSLLGDSDDDIEITTVTGINNLCHNDTSSSCSESACPASKIDEFMKSAVNEDLPRQRFVVSREGMEELKKDILGHYKDNSKKQNVKPRVTFEGEEGVGNGPVREFFLCSIKLVQEGIGGKRRPIIFFEGEKDHLVPLHDQNLRCTGTFRAIGRIIGHSFIHRGPLLYGVSPALKRYWVLTAATNRKSDLETLPASVSIADIPDVDLREYIQQLENISLENDISSDLMENILPYLFEAGLDASNIKKNIKHTIQGLMAYFVIDKRKLELDDIAKGMEEVGLHSFLGKCNMDVVDAVFPSSDKQFISLDELKDSMTFENSEGHKQFITYWNDYLAKLAKYEPGQISLTDLCCFWTACNTLPPRGSPMQVKFDKDSELPTAETCFNSITLPTKHDTYESFCKRMDTALKYGSLGIDMS